MNNSCHEHSIILITVELSVEILLVLIPVSDGELVWGTVRGKPRCDVGLIVPGGVFVPQELRRS